MLRFFHRTLVVFLLAGLLSCSGVPKEPKKTPPKGPKTFPVTKFYNTPNSFPNSGKAGDLIRSEPFVGYVVPPGVTATRILYGTTTSQGNLAVSSGVVLVPAGEAPTGGWPVVAWARGTSGVNRKCAPSLTASSFSMYWAPMIHLNNGYAVVATDYAGAGSDSDFVYMDRIGNAWDIINSVKAARKAVPSLGQKWIGLGSSAGAHALGGVAQLQVDINDPSYLGIITLSGLGNARDPMVSISKQHPALAVFILTAVKARYPDFDYASVLTEKGLGILKPVQSMCQGPGFGRPRPLPVKGPEALVKDWDRKQYVDSYFKMDESGQEKFRGPALVIIGSQETPYTLKNDSAEAKRMCQQGQGVQLSIIPGANHFNLPGKSLDVQSEWIADRFAGRAIPSCEMTLK